MKRSSKLILALLLVFVTFLSACSGGTNNTTTTAAETTKAQTTTTVSSLMTAPGTLPIVNEPVKLTIGMVSNPGVTDYVNNKATKYIKERTGIDIEFTMFPQEESAQKLDLMVSSNETLPDILAVGLSDDAKFQYGQQGVILDLTDYMKNLTYFYPITVDKWASDTEKEKMAVYSKSPDGKQYVFPFLADEPSVDQFWGLYINETWLDKLGLKSPTTLDELQNILIAFRDQDPNGNNKKDEIPAIGTKEIYGDVSKIIMNSFTYWSEYMMNVDNGKLYAPFITEDYKAGLAYIKNWVDQGLISPLTFTQDYAQLKTIMEVPTAKDVKVGLFAAHPTVCFGSPDSWARTNYWPIAPVSGPKGLAYSPRSLTATDYSACITRDCKNPEVAFRLFDFLCEEDACLTFRWGEKDVDWYYAKGGETPTYPDLPAYWVSVHNPYVDSNNLIWRCNPLEFNPSRLSGSGAMEKPADPNTDHFLKMVYGGVPLRKGKNPEQLVEKLLYTAEEREQISQKWTDIQKFVEESRIQFIMGELSIDKDWDKYIQQLKEMGLDQYIETTQKVWTRMNQK